MLATLIPLSCAEDAGTDTKPEVLEPPVGYERIMVFIANAEVPIEDVKPVDGENFHRTIMGRDDKEYEAQRKRALAYFKEKYGVEDAETNPTFLLRSYQVEPNANYRVYYISGEDVPAEGWEVRDGGWELRVISPEGYTWPAGEFAGEFAPPGTYVMYGDYNILTDDCGGDKDCDEPREIVMQYRSRCPIEVPGAELPDVVTFKFSCEVFSDEYGQGLGQGLSQPEFTAGGTKFQYNAREVITFSDRLGF
jgi:hypothetical protein